MLDFIVFFNTITRLVMQLRRWVGQPALTAALLTSLYAGYHVVHESSLGEGLWVAFLETNASRATRLREREDAILQAELRHMADSNKVIDQLLTSLLDRAMTAARVRLDVIHNGVTGVTGMGLLRYDVTNSVAGAGHAPGALVQNQPLSEWADFLPDLLAGRCHVYTSNALGRTAMRGRMEALNVGTLLVCPVADQQGRLLGAIFLLWDTGTRMPEAGDFERLIQSAQTVGPRIATVLDLRTSSYWSAR